MQSHPLLPAELQARYRAEGLWSDDTFFSLLETSAAAAADRPLYLEPEVRTYGEATAAARALAQHLVASGVKPGDGVVTPLVNGLPAAVVSAAVAGAGGRLAPLPSRATPLRPSPSRRPSKRPSSSSPARCSRAASGMPGCSTASAVNHPACA